VDNTLPTTCRCTHTAAQVCTYHWRRQDGGGFLPYSFCPKFTRLGARTCLPSGSRLCLQNYRALLGMRGCRSCGSGNRTRPPERMTPAAAALSCVAGTAGRHLYRWQALGTQHSA